MKEYNWEPAYSLVGSIYRSPGGELYRLTGFTWSKENEDWQAHYRLVGGARNIETCVCPYYEFFIEFQQVVNAQQATSKENKTSD